MKKLISYFIVTIFVACSSTTHSDLIKANNEPLVYMSTAKPPANCKLLGYTKGPYNTFNGNPQQGRNLHQSHINQAIKMGGNYLEKNHFMEKGIVYLCPVDELQKLESTIK